MENKQVFTDRKNKGFNFKKYGYYVVLAFCIGIVSLAMVIGGVAQTSNTNPGTSQVASTAITMQSPLAISNVLKNYSDSELLFNKTLGQWEAHKAIDFAAESGTDVYASLGGTVASVYTNYMEGTVVVVEHVNNLKTIYKSLDSNTEVTQGQEIKKGDLLGYVSASANAEVLEGPHLHFEVWEDDTKIDPSGYLNLEDK